MSELPGPATVAIIPAFNAAGTIAAVAAGVERHGLPIIIVDDGSSDDMPKWLESWLAERGGERASPHRWSLTMPRNSGKAAALQVGFERAAELGFTRALTIDADGQHDTDDIPRLLAASETAFVRGRRDDRTRGYPVRRKLGRALNDLAIQAQTGVRVRDCPCGFRVYPLPLVATVRCTSGRYAWEEEFITRALWAGCEMVEVPVACVYLPSSTGTSAVRSHYRFRRDWSEGVAINLWLLFIAALPIHWRHPRVNSERLRRWSADGLLWGDAIDRAHFLASMVFGVLLAAVALVCPIVAVRWWLAVLAVWLSWRWHGWLWGFAVPVVLALGR